MALKIYKEPNPAAAFSEDGAFTNPVSLTVDGVIGGVVYRRYYIRNDDNLNYYTDITVQPVLSTGLDIVSGATAGFSWKLIAGDTQPIEDQWGLLSGGNQISLADIGSSGNPDTTTYLPFWLRVEVPNGVDVQSFENVNLEVTATVNLA